MKSFSWLLLGAVIGTVVALLYAPLSGPETRQIVKEKALDIKEKAAKAVSSINGSAGSAGRGEGID
jgi:gas vesicle protein